MPPTIKVAKCHGYDEGYIRVKILESWGKKRFLLHPFLPCTLLPPSLPPTSRPQGVTWLLTGLCRWPQASSITRDPPPPNIDKCHTFSSDLILTPNQTILYGHNIRPVIHENTILLSQKDSFEARVGKIKEQHQKMSQVCPSQQRADQNEMEEVKSKKQKSILTHFIWEDLWPFTGFNLNPKWHNLGEAISAAQPSPHKHIFRLENFSFSHLQLF